MKRKVVRQGAATMMVSLPSKWVKKVHLKKGDEIDIEESNGALTISREAVAVKKHATVNISSYTESAVRIAIWNAYRTGYDSVLVRFKDEKQYKIIKDVIKNYIVGFDIVKREKDNCMLENISEPSEEQFDVIFRKILYNISLLLEITEDRLRNKPVVDDYKEVVMKIHQYDNFCRRVITKRHLPYANLLWTFLVLITHGQREIYYLNKFLDTSSVHFRNFEFFEKLKRMFDFVQDGYAKKDIVSIEKMHDLQKGNYEYFCKLIQKNGRENVVLYHISAAMRNFYFTGSPLLSLLLESNISK